MGIRVGGLSSGLDTAALIEAFVRFERRPLDLVEARKSEVETQKSLFRELNTKLSALRDAAADIDNINSTLSAATLDEELLEFTASSSDENVLTASANGNASPGNIDVTVEKVATVGRRFSTTYASDTDPIGAGGNTITITHAGDDDIAITLGTGGASLQDLRDAINSDENNGGNVRAEVLFDGTDYRLIVSGTEAGAANAITMSSDIAGFVDGTLDQAAEDAELTVFGGLPITRPTNSITDVLPGVSMTLKAADPGVPVTIDVARNDEKIGEKFQAFTDAYNDVVEFINAQSRFDETTERSGPLSGNPTLRGLQSTLSLALQGNSGNPYEFDGNPIRSIGEFGLELGRDGLLTFNAGELATAMDEDPFAVREFLSGYITRDGDGNLLGDEHGVATAISAALDPFLESQTGILAEIDSSFDVRIDAFEVQIERMEERLERREELLVLQFSRLETSLAALQGQGSALSGLVQGSSLNTNIR